MMMMMMMIWTDTLAPSSRSLGNDRYLDTETGVEQEASQHTEQLTEAGQWTLLCPSGQETISKQGLIYVLLRATLN
jgi:hypothetical protein